MIGDRTAHRAPDGLAVRVVEDPADREECFSIRTEVFVGEQGIAKEIEYDGHDAGGEGVVHLLALLPPVPPRFLPEGVDGSRFGIPVGTARLLHGPAAGEAEPGTGVLGRLAVVRHARGMGVGGALVRGIEDTARDLGLTAIELHAQSYALRFYERLGYEPYGDEYQEAGTRIAHRAMRRTL
jgi:predicted GNAT family N-acyltransferase